MAIEGSTERSVGFVHEEPEEMEFWEIEQRKFQSWEIAGPSEWLYLTTLYETWTLIIELGHHEAIR